MQINDLTGVTDFPVRELPGGTLLYHGTDTEGDFAIPDGPAWFTFTSYQAREWVGWSTEPPTGRSKGLGRVLVLETYRPITLVDTRSRAVWQRFCEALTGDPEIGAGTMAEAVKSAGYAGWFGHREVMLCDPLGQVCSRGIAKPNNGA